MSWTPGKRIAGAGRDDRRRKKNDDLYRVAAVKRNVAQREDAILGDSRFGTVCLHNPRIMSPWPCRKRPNARLQCSTAISNVTVNILKRVE